MRVFTRGFKHVVGNIILAFSALVLFAASELLPPSPAMAAPAQPGAVPAHAAAPVASQPTALAATRAARRQHSRVEIMADRTAYSQVFANPSGTMTFTESAQPRW